MLAQGSPLSLLSTDMRALNLSGVRLRNCQFGNCDFRKVNLSHADLAGSNLSKCDFRQSVLANANLSNTDLRNSDLSTANLKGAIMSGASLLGVTLPCVLGDIDLSGSDMSGFDLSKFDLSQAKLNGANLSGANLEGCALPKELKGANLSKCNLSNRSLIECDLTDANLSLTNLTNTNLTNANLTNANLSSAILAGANLSATILHNANLVGSDLSNVTGLPTPTWQQCVNGAIDCFTFTSTSNGGCVTSAIISTTPSMRDFKFRYSANGSKGWFQIGIADVNTTTFPNPGCYESPPFPFCYHGYYGRVNNGFRGSFPSSSSCQHMDVTLHVMGSLVEFSINGTKQPGQWTIPHTFRVLADVYHPRSSLTYLPWIHCDPKMC